MDNCRLEKRKIGSNPSSTVTRPRARKAKALSCLWTFRPGAESVACGNTTPKTPVFADSTRPGNFPGGRVWSLARFMPYGAVVCCTVQPCGGFGPPCRIGWQLKPALFSSILSVVQEINLAPCYDPVRYAPAQIPESSEVAEHLHRNSAAQIGHLVAQILGSPNALQGGGKPLRFKSPQRY